ncbi:MAG: peptidoglycan DD-metalloendopeptidase family protein [Deltaproteobacteria bacterium]|nr:peptidoglycan DD-metalloendopeptidase family protein [Deltaproteobacteria bacterium]
MFSFSKTLIIPAIFLFSALAGIPEANSNPTSGLKENQIRKIETKLSREKQKLKTFNSRERNILAILADLEQEVAEKRHSVEKLRKKIRLGENEVKKLIRRQSFLERSANTAETQMARRLVSLYKYSRKGYFKILANAKDLNEFWQRAKYLGAFLEQGRKVLVRLSEEERGYRKQIRLIKEQLVKKEEARNKEKTRLASLREGLEKKVIHLMKIHKEKEFYETAVKELGVAAQNLKQTLLKIEKKDIFKVTRSSRFANFKGQLPFPVEGKIVKGYKGSRPKRLKPQKGVFIEGSSNAEVKAVFHGRVDFSGRLKGYGEVIIINHGSRFFTISANLSQRKKKEGDVLKEGESIGLMGRNGSSKRGRLYFEIRRAGRNLDPLKWLKVH